MAKTVEEEYLPGMEPKKNPKIHPKAMRYAKLRDERIAANEAEKEAHDTLLFVMLEEGVTHYKYGTLEVSIDEKKKCKVNTDAGKPKAESNGESE